MKLSRKFVSDYIDLDDSMDIQTIANDMTSVGNEYDSASQLINCTGLVVGEVLECEDIPETHLHNCKVNVGDEVLNIVCGAPNVRKGIKVIVAMDGAQLPDGVIKKGKIRGYESNGMICSIKELGLDHKFLKQEDIEGIHEFDDDVEVGSDPIKALGLDDEVIDFELTSNRGDLLSILGMAYELGAIYGKKVKDMNIEYQSNDEDIHDEFDIDIQTSDCSLFLAKKVKNVTIKESPAFIKNRLIASGIRPINNVVDISNYVMLETGQPLHFYDADRLGSQLIVRNAKEGEHLTTLDGIDRELSNDDIVIANSREAVGLAGVMGGLSTEVENDTKNIIIESAIFDSIKIRKTSKRILRSEASNRFEKGLDPKRTYLAIERSCYLLEKYANAIIVGNEIVYDHCDVHDEVIELRYDKTNKVLGIDISHEEQAGILSRLGFDVKKKRDKLVVTVPSRRLDIHIEEDLIEEIGRIYGMDSIVGKLPVLDVVTGSYCHTTREIKHKLADLGLNETCSYTLIPKEEVHKFTNDSFQEIMLDHPMSEDRNTLRYSLLYSLKEIYLYNKSYGNSDISLFEMGKSFYQEDGEYKEGLKLAMLMSGNYYIDIPKKGYDFYTVKGIVEELLYFLGYDGRYSFVEEDYPSEFHPYQSAIINVNNSNIGIIGKVHPSVLKDDVYMVEIDLDKLLSIKTGKMKYKEFNRFPSIKKDFAVIVSNDVISEEIIKTIKKSGGKLLTHIEIFDIYRGKNIDSDKMSIGFSLTFSDNKRTLTDDEVNVLFNKIIDDVVKKYDAVLRDN